RLPLVRPASSRSLGVPSRAGALRLMPESARRARERLECRVRRRALRAVRARLQRVLALGARAEVVALPARIRLRERGAPACRRRPRRRARAPHARLRAARHRPRGHRRTAHRGDPRAPTATGRRHPLTVTKGEMAPDVADKVGSLAKRRGFVFPSSEIYGGAGSPWAYRPPRVRANI